MLPKHLEEEDLKEVEVKVSMEKTVENEKIESEFMELVGEDERVVAERRRKMLKNIFLLSFCWCCGVAAAFIQISTTTVAATKLNGKSTSTIPLSLILLVAAISAAFVPKLIARYGAKYTFAVGACLGICGAVIELVGMTALDGTNAFALLAVGSIPQGFTYACTNNFRLAAVQFSTPEFVPKAIAIVVGGGILGAFLGPELSKSSRNWLSVQFAGSYVHIAILYVLLFFTVLLIDFPKKKVALKGNVAEPDSSRTLHTIFRSTPIGLAIFLQAVSYSAMGGLMAATPLAMQQTGYSFSQSTTAITAHMLGMFVPSIISGNVVKRFGPYEVTLSGFLLLFLGAALFLSGTSLAIYITSITIVGVGWNFSFVAATTLVTGIYKTDLERQRVHSINDLIVIGVLGIVLLCTGFLFTAVGWRWFVIIFTIYSAVAVVVSFLGLVKSRSQR